MSFRLWRRKKIAPGVTLNMSKSGVSVSLGPPGAKVTLGSRGTQITFGLPGSGMFWTKRLPPITELVQRPIPPELPESAWSRALDSLNAGDVDQAYGLLEQVNHADAAWLRGVIALGQDRDTDAEQALRRAWSSRNALGSAPLARDLTVDVPIAREVSFALKTDETGAAIALAEAIQGLGRPGEALALLNELEDTRPTLQLARADLAIELGQLERAKEYLLGVGSDGPAGALAALLREQIRIAEGAD